MIYSVVIADNIETGQLLILHDKLPQPIVDKVAFMWLMFFDYSSVITLVHNRNYDNLILVAMEGYFVLADRKTISTKQKIIELF